VVDERPFGLIFNWIRKSCLLTFDKTLDFIQLLLGNLLISGERPTCEYAVRIAVVSPPLLRLGLYLLCI